MYEGEKKDKHALLGDVNRLSGLVDAMQSEARDVVPPLPSAGARASQSRTVSDVEDVVETVLHRLALSGAIGGSDFKAIRAAMQGRTSDGRGEATEAPGGDGGHAADSAESGAAGEPRPTAEPSHTASGAATADDAAGAKDRKWKRPSPVNVPPFPTVAQMSQWQRTVARALVASSVYDDKAEVAWFKRASGKGSHL